MKYLFAIVLTMSVMTISCKKEYINHDLVGNWKIIGSGGGITGQGGSFNFNTMLLNKNNVYQFIRNDTVIEKGSYAISTNNIGSSNEKCKLKIDFSVESKIGIGANNFTYDSRLVEFIKMDTLALYEPLIDGFVYYFVKSNK
jgi:hypothetical protein